VSYYLFVADVDVDVVVTLHVMIFSLGSLLAVALLCQYQSQCQCAEVSVPAPAPAPAPVDLLFVLHDAGESLGLQPVLDALIQDNITRISILCLGKSRPQPNMHATPTCILDTSSLSHCTLTSS
jgi:hypothetical protein